MPPQKNKSRFGNNKGAAMLLAVFTLSFVIFLAMEIADLSIAEYLASAGEVKKVQAFYAAKSCYQLSLLRIKAYQQATATLGKGGAVDMSIIDMIWKFPLAWPPGLPKEASSFDKSSFKDSVAKSSIKHQFASSITAEGGRLDINDLGSPSKTLRARTRRQILERLEARVQNNDDDFAERYANFNFEELLNNITDWIDTDNSGLNGGGEKGLYSDYRNEFIPPNRPIKTLEELHMISGMTDDIYAVLAPEITLFGVKGINVNQAEQEVLFSLFSRYPKEEAQEVVQKILQRRNDPNLGGPFKDEQDFMGLVGAYADPDEFNDERIPLFFGAEQNFRINCSGVSGNIIREFDAVVYNGEEVEARLSDALKLDEKDNTNPNDPNTKCDGLIGNDKYDCLCEDEETPTKKAQCINKAKKADAKKKQDQGKGKTKKNTQGPPKVIYLRVQ